MERRFHRGVLEAGIEDLFLALHKLCTTLHQRQGKAMKMRASGSQRIHISASYFHTQNPQVPFCCHTIRREQNLLAQLLESNRRLIACAGMWVGTLSMCVGASGNMSLRKHPFSPQKHCSTTGIPSDLYSFKL